MQYKDNLNGQNISPIFLRTLCIKDENAFMLALANRIAGNANPEEDSRLDVAYAIARHLKLNWPSAYENNVTKP